MLSYFTTFFLLCSIYELPLLKLIKIFVTSILLTSILDIIFLYLLRSFGIINELACSIGYSAIVLFLLWGYGLFFLKKTEITIFHLPARIWRILIEILGILAAMLAFFAYVLLEMRQDIKITGVVFILGGGLAICILIFFLIYYFNSTQKYQMQNKIAEEFALQQKEYFLQLLEKERETKKFRHDITNHLLELQNMCENQQYTDTELYINRLLDNIITISHKKYNVGNEIINTMLNYYFSQLTQPYDIRVEGYISDKISITQTDLCTIVSNLIKNAIEATARAPKKNIYFSVHQGKHFLKIQTKNTYETGIKINKNGMPISTKKDKANHGYGFQNMQQAVKKYDGQLIICQEENVCTITIYLKI